MRRPAFTVVVLPYAVTLDGEVSYAIFRRASRGDASWHALNGAAVRGETPLEAARRESWRIAAIPPDAAYLALDTRRAIVAPDPTSTFAEHVFGVRVCLDEVCPRRGRLEHHWVSYEIARGLLHASPEGDALWELRRRVGRPTSCL